MEEIKQSLLKKDSPPDFEGTIEEITDPGLEDPKPIIISNTPPIKDAPLSRRTRPYFNFRERRIGK